MTFDVLLLPLEGGERGLDLVVLVVFILDVVVDAGNFLSDVHQHITR